MIKEVTVFNGKRTSIQYEMTLFAFRTEKGVFTMVGSSSDGSDEWRQIGRCNFHSWQRKKIYEWFVSGRIIPIEEANRLNWRDKI